MVHFKVRECKTNIYQICVPIYDRNHFDQAKLWINTNRSSVRLFADDCVLYRNIKSPIDCQILQDDLNSLSQ